MDLCRLYLSLQNHHDGLLVMMIFDTEKDCVCVMFVLSSELIKILLYHDT